MRTRSILILLTMLLALGTAPLLGCNEEDPSQNNDNNGNNGMTDTGVDAEEDTRTDDVEEDSTTEDGGDDGATDDGGDDGGTTCTPFTDFTGQAFAGGSDPDPHNGGNPVEGGTIDYDANLQAAYDLVPLDASDDNVTDETGADTPTIYVRTLDTPIDVTEALVVATGFDSNQTPNVDEANQKLWLNDTNSALQFWFAFPEGEVPTDPIKVGDRISFKATELTNYGGTPEISGIESDSFTNVSSGNDVPFTDYTGMEIPVDDYLRPVRVAGVITSEARECGATCFDLTHGAEGSEQTTELRTNSQFIAQGDCVTFFGPLGSFPTPLADADAATVQLNEQNFNWLFTSQ